MTVRSLRVRDIFVTPSQFSLGRLEMTDTQISLSLRCRSCALSSLLSPRQAGPMELRNLRAGGNSSLGWTGLARYGDCSVYRQGNIHVRPGLLCISRTTSPPLPSLVSPQPSEYNRQTGRAIYQSSADLSSLFMKESQ